MRDKVSQATGFVRGIRAVIASMLTTEPTPKPPAHAGGIVMNTKKTTGVTSEKLPKTQEGSWHTNTIASNVKMVADRF